MLGLPRGELAWAIAYGAFWPVFVGYVLDVRVERRARGAERSVRRSPDAARPAEAQVGAAEPVKPWCFSFPQDHGSHPAFATEWWYVSGNLSTSTGSEWGVQFAVFRHRPTLRLGRILALQVPTDGFAAHLAITDCQDGAFRFFERLGSQVMGTAGARTGALDVRVRGWSLKAAGQAMRLVAREPSCGVDLDLRPRKAPVLNGHRGFSVKARSPEGASQHYSVTAIDARGTIEWDDQIHEVSGTCWLDREFGSRIFPSVVEGWDWFSLSLDNGFELMILRVRQDATDALAAAHATLVAPDGSSQCLREEDFRTSARGCWLSPISGARYPMGWRISLPAHGADFEVRPIVEDHELNAEPFWRMDYWEGPVRVTGTMGNGAVTGRGYAELTGYAQPIGGRF